MTRWVGCLILLCGESWVNHRFYLVWFRLHSPGNGKEDIKPEASPQVSIYRSSKTAINMIMAVYAKMLESEAFVVSASDPGFCATNMDAYSGMKDASEGVKMLIHAATCEKKDVHGHMIIENGVVPW